MRPVRSPHATLLVREDGRPQFPELSSTRARFSTETHSKGLRGYLDCNKTYIYASTTLVTPQAQENTNTDTRLEVSRAKGLTQIPVPSPPSSTQGDTPPRPPASPGGSAAAR